MVPYPRVLHCTRRHAMYGASLPRLIRREVAHALHHSVPAHRSATAEFGHVPIGGLFPNFHGYEVPISKFLGRPPHPPRRSQRSPQHQKCPKIFAPAAPQSTTISSKFRVILEFLSKIFGLCAAKIPYFQILAASRPPFPNFQTDPPLGPPTS